MNTIDDLIENLIALRKEIGKNCDVFVDGWHHHGIVTSVEPAMIRVKKTGVDKDGEILRVYEESIDGDYAVLISNEVRGI